MTAKSAKLVLQSLVVNVRFGLDADSATMNANGRSEPFSTVSAPPTGGGFRWRVSGRLKTHRPAAHIVQLGAFDTGIMQKSPPTDDPERMAGYGPTLEQAQAMAARFMGLAQKSSVEASAVMVADAIADPLKLPYGKRPLRTIVDPSEIGALANAMNAAVATKQERFQDAIGAEFSFPVQEAAE